jgi:hypothetical protein
MTNEQRKSVQKYKLEFEQNCDQYAGFGSGLYCKFNLFKSANQNDPNITMIVTTITGISDFFEPYVETVNLMVEPDGNVIKLSDFFNSNEVVSYLEQLKKVE